MRKTYVKITPKAAAVLGILQHLSRLADGNVICMNNHLLPLGRMADLDQHVEAVGGVRMTQLQALNETKGTTTTPLPEPTDARFIMSEEEKKKYY